MNPNSRPTANEILQYKWFSQTDKGVDTSKELIALQTLKKFSVQSGFQKAILIYFVNFFNLQDERYELLKIF